MTTTTETPAPVRHSGRVDLVATSLDALHHGAGTSGNTSLLRTQDIIDPHSGHHARVPYVSGSSLRHMLRAALARHLVRSIDLQPRSVSKAAVDLLWSGGALTSVGANVDLDILRQVEDILPGLSLLGYSAGNTMSPGKLRVDNLHLLCAENMWRAPSTMTGLPAASLRAGALRDSAFGTRHDAAGDPVARQVLDPDGDVGTSQMIWDYEVVKPGAMWWTALHVDEVTLMELAALHTAVVEASEGIDEHGNRLWRLAAKGASGHGRVAVTFVGDGIAHSWPDPVDAYTAHCEERRTEIFELIGRLTG